MDWMGIAAICLMVASPLLGFIWYANKESSREHELEMKRLELDYARTTKAAEGKKPADRQST